MKFANIHIIIISKIGYYYNVRSIRKIVLVVIFVILK